MSLLVGSDRRNLIIHRSHLERTSPCFQSDVKSAPLREDGAVIVLREEDPETLNLYFNFVYTGAIPCQRSATPVFDGIATPDVEGTELAKLYLLGEKYQDVRLRDAAIRSIFAKGKNFHTRTGGGRFLTGSAVDIIYKGSNEDSPAREVMV